LRDPYTPAVNRYQAGLDPRLSMTIVGGVLGVALVGFLFAMRGPSVPPFDYAGGAAASYPPPPFEPLGPQGLFESYARLGAVTVNGSAGRLSISKAGDVVLPSGRVVAGDAFLLDDPPFTITLSPGIHPVLLLHVTGGDFGAGVAAAMVRLGEAPVARWEGAQIRDMPPGSDPFVYGVDGGTGSFTSPEAIARLRSMPSASANALFDRLVGEYSKGGEYVQTATMTVDGASGMNIVTFSSGFGDGAYASWFGFDAAGTPVALLTSFDLIDDPSRPTGSARPSRSPAGSIAP
jgi:hypothetical protein